MVEVKAFKGISYNTGKIKDFDKVMSPPYDIISSDMQQQLYENSPYNFVRLILGKQNETDTEDDNRYTRAKKDFTNWFQDSILESSDTPAIYPYKIEYAHMGKKLIFSGFFILLKLDPTYTQVKAHERTLSKPKADRLNLLRACHANLEPIQLLYIDEHDSIQKKIEEHISPEPFISVQGYDSFTHKLWRCIDPSVIQYIQEKLSDEILFIADGHHRYQTALNYADEMTSTDPSDDAPFQYRMVILANMFDEGLEILPTHRFITIPNINRNQLLDSLSNYFTVETKEISKDNPLSMRIETMKSLLDTQSDHKFILYFKDAYYLLTLKDEKAMERFARERSETWKTLDVSILHKIIIESIMGISQDAIEDHIKYTRDDLEAIQQVDNGTYDLSVLMNATKINELKQIAEAGEHMPQKSTYFLPKMLSGLVMYKME